LIFHEEAYTSRAFDIETKEWQSISIGGESSASCSTTAKIMILRRHSAEGGCKVVGAIGVSGGSGDQDHAVAAAGAAAF